MSKRIIVDTNALIRYLGIQTRSETRYDLLSDTGKELIRNGLSGEHAIFISSLSIIEVWSNIHESTEIKERLIQTVKQLYEEEFLRIVPLSKQTVEYFLGIPEDSSIKEHDKIIFATAIEYGCNVMITSDQSIIEYCKKSDTGVSIIS